MLTLSLERVSIGVFTFIQSATTAFRILAYDVLFAHSAEELHRLAQEKMADGWTSDGTPKDKMEKDAFTGKTRYVYWQPIVKYAGNHAP